VNDALKHALHGLLGTRCEETASAMLLSPASERELSQILRLLSRHGGWLRQDVLGQDVSGQDVSGQDVLGREVIIRRSRLSEVGPIDDKSAVVRVGAGVKLSTLELSLTAQGYSLGPLSPGACALELGDFLEGPYAGLRGIPGGRLEPLSMALEAVTRAGVRHASRATPRSAAGPHLDALFLGAGGRVGLIFAATLRLYAKPAAHRAETFSFPNEAAACAALRRTLDDGAFLERVHLERRADRVLAEVCALGTPEGVERDLVTLFHRVANVGGRNSPHRVEDSLPVPSLEREATWEAVAAAVKAGQRLWLYRLAVDSVVAEGQVEGVSLSRPGAALPPGWQAVLTQVDPELERGGES